MRLERADTSHREEVNQTFTSREAAGAAAADNRPDLDPGPVLSRPPAAGAASLGHLPVGMLTGGLIDRAVDR